MLQEFFSLLLLFIDFFDIQRFKIFVCLFNLRLCWVFVVAQAFSLVVVPELLIAVASLVKHGL